MSKSWIPNLFTSLNIALGAFSILCSFNHLWQCAALAILLALVADALDGRTARFFGVAGDFGKELDSLCDVVSFGVAPGILLYGWQIHELPGYIGEIVAIVFAICGAMRLARFNINTTVVKGFFMGLPIPTAGCLVATYVLSNAPAPSYIVAVVAILVGLMMVSEIHYPDFKGKGSDPIQIKAVVAVAVIVVCVGWDNPARWPFLPFLAYFIFGILNTCWNCLMQTTERGEVE